MVENIRKEAPRPAYKEAPSAPKSQIQSSEVKSKKGDKTVEEDGRDLGAMISVLTVAVQQLTNRLEILEAK